MSVSPIKLEVEKQYKIAKHGVQVTLTEEELKELLLSDEIMQVVMKLIHAPISENLDSPNAEPEEAAAPTFPKGFEPLKNLASDPKSPYKSIFFYAKSKDGEYGFKSFSGKRYSPFNRLGKLDDPNSILGDFVKCLKDVPHDQEWIKQDFFNLPLKYIREGRRMKAVVDILEIEGYLTKRPLKSRNDRIGYRKTEKFNELEAVGNRDG